MNIYEQLTKNTTTKVFISLVLVLFATFLESKIELISPRASILGFYPIVLASFLFFHPIATAVLGAFALQYFILSDNSLSIKWSEDIWVHAFIGLGCYGFYRIKEILDKKLNTLSSKLELEESQRYYFTQNIGNFIKSHTRIIQQGGKFMKDNPPTHEKYQKGLNLLIFKTDELDQLANDILDVSHWSKTGKLELEFSLASLRTIILKNIDHFSKSHPDMIDFEIDARGELSLLNESALNRMLQTFIQHALTKSQGKKIKIQYSEDEKILNLKIHYYADPIAKNDIPNLFVGFSKLFLNTQTDQNEGLQLSLAKAITDAHSGSIKVISDENEGTVFDIYIPIKKLAE